MTLGHDVAGRITSRTVGSQTETLAYDQGAYGKGRPTILAGTGGSISFAHEAGGRLASQTVAAQGQTLTVGWSYDTTGKLTGMSYPDGQTLSFHCYQWCLTLFTIQAVDGNTAWITGANGLVLATGTGGN